MNRIGLEAPTHNTKKFRMCILRPQPTTQTSPEPAKAWATHGDRHKAKTLPY